MELPALSVVSDDELLEEALAILDTVDIERLAGLTHIQPSETADADDLLETAIQAVQSAYPQNGHTGSSTKASPKDKTGQYHGNQKYGATSSDRGVVQGFPPANITGNTSPRSRRRGGGRMRMREQLIQLRSVVQKMENHLETLRSPRSPQLSVRGNLIEDLETATKVPSDENENSNVKSTSKSADEAAVWRNIAMQQFRARRKAQQQNAELRENLAAQVLLSNQVEGLLQQELHPDLLLEHATSSLKPDSNTEDTNDAGF